MTRREQDGYPPITTWHEAQKAAVELIGPHVDRLRAARMAGPSSLGSIKNMEKLAEGSYRIGFQGDPDLDAQQVHENFRQYSLDNPDFGVAYILPSVQIMMNWTARWYEQGMPRVVWDNPKYPAMLMASKCDPNVAGMVKPPWEAFLVDLPEGLVMEVDGDESPIKWALVHAIPSSKGLVWNILLEADGMEIWRHGLTTEQLVEVGNGLLNPVFGPELDQRDLLILTLVGRLVIGLCLTLSDPSKVREVKRKERARGSFRMVSKKNKGKGTTRNFVVGAPVNVDCRKAIKEAIQKPRKGHVLTVRSLVRGHWKMQPHGPRNSLRKLIFREPFWRGPKDAPIVKREHVVGDAE